MFIVSKGRVWRRFSSELFDGYAPEPMPTGNEYMHWRGGRISIALWQTILCFFLEHKTDEVQLRLYYNTVTRQWGAHAFPQRWPTGMTTRELEDHANFQVDLALFPEPWAYMGTVHHHCSAGAFQSGTDHSNETGIVGLHITVGKLNDPMLDLHGRICVKFPGELDGDGNVIRPGVQQFYENPLWSNWFELPAPVASVLPASMHESILTTLLKTPVGKEVGFPERWKENLIRFCHDTTPGTWPGWSRNEHGGFNYAGDSPVDYRHGGGGPVQSRDHPAPRSAQVSSAPTRAFKKAGEGFNLPTAAAIGMRDDEHVWLLNSVLALMDPYFPVGTTEPPAGSHVDLEVAWEMLEFTSLSEAHTTLQKMGFVKTFKGTYCHPEELIALNQAMLKEANRDAATRLGVTTPNT